MTPPLGFWDPLGFSKFESPEADVSRQKFGLNTGGFWDFALPCG